MEWLTQNWYWVLLIAVIGLHLFGHGGHGGGHGGHGRRRTASARDPRDTQGHQH